MYCSPCPLYAAPIVVGFGTVFVNGLGCGRVGDGISECIAVAADCTNCFAGG